MLIKKKLLFFVVGVFTATAKQIFFKCSSCFSGEMFSVQPLLCPLEARERIAVLQLNTPPDL